MIRHLLKLVWHRKRANALITLEIFASFLIVFFVAVLGASLWSRWSAPLGFDWQDIWVLSVASTTTAPPGTLASTPASASVESPEQRRTRNVEEVLTELKAFPQIESAGACAMAPYSSHTWTTVLETGGRRVDVTADRATNGFAKAMRMRLVRGRWFTEDDEAQNFEPLVIDTDAAAALFGDADPVGRVIPTARPKDFTGAQIPTADMADTLKARDMKVVGVIEPYRKDGEFTATKLRMVFFRVSTRSASEPIADQIVVRLRPGTPASFEAELTDRLRPQAAGVKIRVRRMADMRRGSLRLALVPLTALTIVAIFLVSMVALGLTGVLWQTVTRRTREIGLRRAVGASRSGVRRQVLGELAVLVTLAVIGGGVVIAQLPLLGIFRIASPADFTLGIVAALAAIYGITLLCGAYPSWLASTIQPAEALHYE